MNTGYFLSSKPLPSIPENATKEIVIKILKEHAVENNFKIVIARSTSTNVHLKCVKGGTYRNTRKLTEEDRQVWKNSQRTNCPFLIRVAKSKNGGFIYLKPTTESEKFHNHELTKENLLATSDGRKSLLDSNDIEKLQRGIDQNLPTKTIQHILSGEADYNKLTVHDINNIRYTTATNRVDVNSDDSATLIINHIKAANFIVESVCNSVSRDLEGLFFSKPSLLDRAKRFPEVI